MYCQRFRRIRFSATVLLLALVSPLAADTRDHYHQPEKVMDVTGVKPGMVIGEVGAGRGYFTFKLRSRVGETGFIYANDINEGVLSSLEARCRREDITNIETIKGEVADPLFPPGKLDMVFIVNAFHDLAEPVALLDNLVPALKPGARVVIIDRDPAKYNDRYHHFLTREAVVEKIAESALELDKIETFLTQHNIYIARLATN